MVDPADELDVLAAAEETNYRQTRRVFGESLSLFDDIIGLYDFLGALNRDSGGGGLGSVLIG